MANMKELTQELNAYMLDIFHRLHMYPEVGFELPRTTALVKAELDKLGIASTDRYGKCSLVAQIGQKPDVPTLGIRADMDALPVQEQTDLPYRSKIDGAMHACGHDSHTAILLTVAKILKSREAELPCNVRLLFQPSEEGAVSGAKMMADNGCLEGVDAVICVHCEEALPSGSLGYQKGECMAACVPLCLKFHGITSHATIPEAGVDAIAMAAESYGALKAMVKEEAGDRPYIWSVGVFQGGEVHNVIADLCTQYISFRFYDEEFAERVHKRTVEITEEIAARYGGRIEVLWHMSCPPVNNDAALVAHLEKVAAMLPGVELIEMPAKRSSEDFSWFTAQRPGMLFRYGIHNEAKGCVAAAHRPDFMVDEDTMQLAALAFVNFAMTYGK